MDQESLLALDQVADLVDVGRERLHLIDLRVFHGVVGSLIDVGWLRRLSDHGRGHSRGRRTHRPEGRLSRSFDPELPRNVPGAVERDRGVDRG